MNRRHVLVLGVACMIAAIVLGGILAPSLRRARTSGPHGQSPEAIVARAEKQLKWKDDDLRAVLYCGIPSALLFGFGTAFVLLSLLGISENKRHNNRKDDTGE